MHYSKRKPLFDPEAVRRAIEKRIRPGAVFEYRAVDATLDNDRREGVVFGFFDSAEALIKELPRVRSAKGQYITANPVDPKLHHRAFNKLKRGKSGDATADKNITRRVRLIVDVDADRLANISATDGEHDAALTLAAKIRAALSAEGWPEPLYEDSGNGGRLNYAIDLPVDDGGLVKRCVEALAARYNGNGLSIDTTVHNPARIDKLPGTRACKGDDTPECPHRMAHIIDAPDVLRVVPVELLEALANDAPGSMPTQMNGNSGGSRNGDGGRNGGFDLEAWIAEHCPDAGPPKRKADGDVWVLPVCPWDASHTGGCAHIIRRTDGKTGAACKHNSCAGKGWHDLRDAVEPGWRDKANTTSAAKGKGKRGKGDGNENDATNAELIVRQAHERYRFARTEADEPFAVEKDGPNVAILFKGRGDALRKRLAAEFRRRTMRTPGSSALADAMAVLEGAALDAESEPVALRVTRHGEAIVVDLGDKEGRAVIVEASGWRVVARSPVLFRRTALTGRMPAPERGGSLADLRGLLNVTDKTWPLAVAVLVAALIPDIPHAIVLFGGAHGTGKSTAAEFLVSTFDASPVPLRSCPKDVEQWAIAAAGSWGVVLDNVSHIPAWLSDALCRAATGDGWLRRALWTDCDLAVLTFRRVVMLTSIDPGALKGDLGDRLLILDLEPIAKGRRRSEKEMKKAFAQARARIFGAVLDTLVAVLSELPKVHLVERPRMADFADVLAALDATGMVKGKALDEFAEQRSRVALDVLDADEFALAVKALVEREGRWQGRASELIEKLTPDPLPKSWPPKGWPKTPQAVTGQLKRLAPVLGEAGVVVTIPRERTKYGRVLTLESTGGGASPASPTSPGGENPDGQAAQGGDDAGDDGRAAGASVVTTEDGGNVEESGGGDDGDDGDVPAALLSKPDDVGDLLDRADAAMAPDDEPDAGEEDGEWTA